MPEVASRSSASRGRGGGRGGRGGYAGRGGRSSTSGRVNGDHKDSSSSFGEEGGDIAELRHLYGSLVSPIKDMFNVWSEIDILYLLKETEGDADLAVSKILEGSASQWDEVPKKQTVPRKAKEPTPAPVEPAKPIRPIRTEATRGRGKPAERGTRAPRGRIVSSTNGAPRAPKDTNSVPTDESSAWGSTFQDEETPVTTKPAAPAGKSWASLLRQPPAPKPVAKPKEAPTPETEAIELSAETEETEETEETAVELGSAPAPEAPVEEEVDETEAVVEAEPVEETEPVELETTPAVEVVEPNPLAPPQVPVATPLPVPKPAPIPAVVHAAVPAAVPAPVSSAVPSAVPSVVSSAAPTPITAPAVAAVPVAAATPGKTPARHTRLLDQQEAVRMPGNRDLDRATVQFGFLNLGADEEEEREEMPTRPQPAVEPPITLQTSIPSVVPEPLVQKPAAAPVVVPSAAPSAAPVPTAAPIPTATHGNPAPGFNRDIHYSQKPYDSFGQQIPQQPAVDGFPSQPAHQGNAFSAAPNDYSSVYAEQQRNYGAFYGQGAYGHSPQDGLPPVAGQQRPFMNNYQNASQTDAVGQYQQNTRFGGVSAESQNSGHNTPAPNAVSAQQQPQPPSTGPSSNPQSQFQQHYSQQGNPYYNQPYYGNYGGYPYGQAAFNAPGYGKNSMYGNYPASFEQHNSAAGFSQASHRDNGIASSSDYNRQGGAQGGAPGLTGGFGGVHDSFARGPSAYQAQTSQAYNSPAQGAGPATSEDLKTSYNDGKVGGGGPSPALSGARPGSAANNGVQANQAGLPPQSMGGYNGYPHALHNSYGATGQHSNYSSYQSGFGGFYGQHGGQQHRGGGANGWGGNYH